MPLLDQTKDVLNRQHPLQLSPSLTTWKASCIRGVMANSYGYTLRDRNRGDSRLELFKTLEFTESRKRPVVMSVAIHGVLLSVLLLIPLIFTETIRTRFSTTLLAPPMPKEQILEVTHYKEPPRPKPVIAPKPIVAPPPKPKVVEPPEIKKPEPPKPKPPEIKLPEVEHAKPAPVVRNTPHLDSAEPSPAAAPKPEIKTGMFSTGSSATPTTNLPAQKVQTGGFGDPNGVKATGKPGKAANIAELGSFDLPTGPGAGNGTGGSHGVKGTVQSSGFGNGVAPVGSGGGGSGVGGRSVRQGGFGDVDGTAKPDAPKKRLETGPPQIPVEILFKPKPDYTQEARQLKIEGEVLVRVMFTAAGEVRVLEVMKGLGHGLDESALRAAKQIKFKPAQRDGQPVDSTATVHIVFQLAY